jgi:hypothetical protein
MAWETRRGRKYYYRATRVNGRVVKLYVGAGEEAAAAAAADSAGMRRKLICLEQRRIAVAAFAQLQGCLEEYWAITERLAFLAFTACRYHRRGGEWRLRNERRSNT